MGGRKKYRSLGISIHPEHWDFERNQPRRNCPNKEYIAQVIRAKESELQKRILELQARGEGLGIEEIFEECAKVKAKTVGEFYLSLIEKHQQKGETGNARIYLDSYRSIKTFRQERMNFPFSDITERWLEKYEDWLRSKGNKDTTMSVMFRTLRSAYNKAIQARVADERAYPFNAYKISRFDTRTKKRSITKNEVMQIIGTDFTGKRYYRSFSRDLFVFSYLCGGISFADMAYLTAENISEGRLEYKRQKTDKKITLPLHPDAVAIISRHADSERGYLFPILDKREHKTPQQRHNRIHKVIGKVNDNLKTIGRELGLNITLTTYVARHTFATVLKRSGVSVAIISESLGHSDLATTQIYLDSFDNSQIDEAMRCLV